MGQLLDTVRALQLDRPETWVPDLGPVQPDTLPPSSPSQRLNLNFTAEQPPPEEDAFRQWYGAWADRFGMNPDPDAPEQHYNYRAAFKAGVQPPNVERGEHWPSTFKTAGHENLVVGGFHTQTGERVPGTPRASSVEELIQLGWDPETAKVLAGKPEPKPEPEPDPYWSASLSPQVQYPTHPAGAPLTGWRRAADESINAVVGTFKGVTGLGDQGPAGPSWANAGALAAAVPLGLPEAAVKEVAKRFPRFAKAITAYHGSPHDFEKFSLEKIGTGEGAQAYGHGLYFAESEGVAKSYRDVLAQQHWNDRAQGEALFDTLADRGIVVDGKVPFGPNRTLVSKDDLASGFVSGQYNIFDVPPGIQKQVAERLPKGKMYEVNIQADPAHFLDWDAPLSQQSKKIQNIAQEAVAADANVLTYDQWIKLPAESRKRYIAEAHAPENAWALSRAQRRVGETGEQLYRAIAGSAEGSPVASQALRRRGIPGIKYADAGSRLSGDAQGMVANYGSREKALEIAQQRLKSAEYGDLRYWENMVEQLDKPGTRNYVVFDDALIDILKKYGLSAATIGLLHRALNDRAEHDQ